MKRKRRDHSTSFKAKVALAAIRGDKTLAELSEQFDVHQNQIQDWRRMLLDKADQVFDRGGTAQGRDPTDTGMAFQFINLGLREHAPVTHQDHPIKLKALLECVHLIRHRRWVTGITGINLHRKRTALSVCQHPIDHDRFTALFIATVARANQRAGVAFIVTATDIIKHLAAFTQMPLCQLLFDA